MRIARDRAAPTMIRRYDERVQRSLCVSGSLSERLTNAYPIRPEASRAPKNARHCPGLGAQPTSIARRHQRVLGRDDPAWTGRASRRTEMRRAAGAAPGPDAIPTGAFTTERLQVRAVAPHRRYVGAASPRHPAGRRDVCRRLMAKNPDRLSESWRRRSAGGRPGRGVPGHPSRKKRRTNSGGGTIPDTQYRNSCRQASPGPFSMTNVGSTFRTVPYRGGADHWGHRTGDALFVRDMGGWLPGGIRCR